MTKKISFAATGHRPSKVGNAYELNHPKALEIISLLKEKLKELTIDKHGDIQYDEIECISGMALGMDMYFAEAILELKKEYPQFKLIAAVPCTGHSLNWPKSSQFTHQRICDAADEYVLVTNAPFKPYLMQVRNEYMVNRADRIISLWDGTSGGTGNCVKYALKQNKPILNLHPTTYVWEEIENMDFAKKETLEDDNQLTLF